jgi:hypothetical protein
MVKGLNSLQKLDEKQVQLLWHFDWWDGPLNGLAEYLGQKSWFAYHGMDDPGGHYYYKLYLLSKEQADQTSLWKETQGTWDSEKEKWIGRDEAKHDLNWKSPVLPDQQPIGWFLDGANSSFYGIQVTYAAEPGDAADPPKVEG